MSTHAQGLRTPTDRTPSSFHQGLVCVAVIAALATLLLPLSAADAQRRISTKSLPSVWNDAVVAGKVRVIDRGSVATKATSVAKTADEIQLRPGQIAIAEVAKTTRTELRVRPGTTNAVDTVKILPYSYLTLGSSGEEIRLRHTYITESALKYDRAADEFKGSVRISLENSADQRQRDTLPEGIFRMAVAASTGKADPSDLEWRFTPVSNKVSISIGAPLDSVRIDLVPTFDTTRTALWIPVRPALTIKADRSIAAGYGIRTVPVTVRVVGATVRDPVAVTLTSSLGTFESDRVMIGPDGSAKAMLRTEGRGKVALSATTLGYETASDSMEFTWPFAFLCFSLAGGAVGAVAARVSKKTRSKLGTTARAAVVGMLIGFVVAIVYVALDINLLAIKIGLRHFDEAAIFALSLLGGALGVAPFARRTSEGSRAGAGASAG